MADLTNFLLARLDDDERDARDSSDDDSPGTWRHWAESVCAAHRRAIEEYAALLVEREEVPKRGHVWRGDMYLRGLERPLLLLAGVYADHPDYREEWRL